ncbi:MAG TPA: SAM hydroxide adenosyltransferase, partial [Planctomycetota bacterium]|nr:SAM hydroxide adenosyltransferase [Planctomycetota bacterium]
PPSRVGPPVASILRLPATPGRVVWIDRFGNLVTDLLPGPRGIRFRGRRIPVARTYASSRPGALVAVVGSAGTLEISVVEGSAARRLGAKIGDVVR